MVVFFIGILSVKVKFFLARNPLLQVFYTEMDLLIRMMEFMFEKDKGKMK